MTASAGGAYALVMMVLKRVLLCLALIWPGLALADDRVVGLYAPPELIDTGLMKHILPRFKLKTQVRVDLVDPSAAQVVLGPDGRALFQGAGATWHLSVPGKGHKGTDRFADWLISEIGQNTVFSFAPDGIAVFEPPSEVVAEVEEVVVTGDVEWGHQVSLEKCTRCHAVDANTAWSSIGSTPSFAVLRSFPDWENRFGAFYVLKPHAAFTQIEDLTEPFPEDRPSPIAPIELTIDELYAMIDYVAAMEAADLGAPLQHQ